MITSAPHLLALHLTSPSGSEAKVLAALLRHKDADLRVSLIVNDRGIDDRHSYFRVLEDDPSVTVIPFDVGLPVDHWKPDSAALRLLSRASHIPRRLSILRLARSLQPDVIYTSQQRFDCRIGSILSGRLGLPHIVHLHYLPDMSLRRTALDRLHTCDQVIAVSQFVADLAVAQGVDPAKLTVIHNTIELSPGSDVDRHDRDPTTVTVGQFGRMHPGKGFPETVRAFAHLSASQPEARLMLIGEGSERCLITSMVHELRLDGVVQILPWQPGVDSFLGELDIFMHPSRQEPFGLAVVEAMAARLPVIAWREGGICETVDDGVTGMLVPPDDDAGLATALIRLAANPDERRAFGDAGRARVAERFAPPPAGRAFSATVNGVVGNVSHR